MKSGVPWTGPPPLPRPVMPRRARPPEPHDTPWPDRTGLRRVTVAGRTVKVRQVKTVMTTNDAGQKVPAAALGIYDMDTDTIHISTQLGLEVWWTTLQHEMAHAWIYGGPLRTIMAKVEEPHADGFAEARMATARRLALGKSPQEAQPVLLAHLTHL